MFVFLFPFHHLHSSGFFSLSLRIKIRELLLLLSHFYRPSVGGGIFSHSISRFLSLFSCSIYPIRLESPPLAFSLSLSFRLLQRSGEEGGGIFIILCGEWTREGGIRRTFEFCMDALCSLFSLLSKPFVYIISLPPVRRDSFSRRPFGESRPVYGQKRLRLYDARRRRRLLADLYSGGPFLSLPTAHASPSVAGGGRRMESVSFSSPFAFDLRYSSSPSSSFLGRRRSKEVWLMDSFPSSPSLSCHANIWQRRRRRRHRLSAGGGKTRDAERTS